MKQECFIINGNRKENAEVNGIRKYLIWVIAGIFVVFAAVCIIVAYNVGISLHMHDYGIEGDKALQEENYFRAEEYFERARNVDSDKNTKCQYQMAVEYCNTGQLDKAEELLYSLDGKQKDVIEDMIFRMYLEKDQLYDAEGLFRKVSKQMSEKMRRKLEEVKYEKAVKAYKEGFYSDAEKLLGEIEDNYKGKKNYMKKISKIQNKISKITNRKLISVSGNTNVRNDTLLFITSEEDALEEIKKAEEKQYTIHLFTILSKEKKKMQAKSIYDGNIKQISIEEKHDVIYTIGYNGAYWIFG